MNASSLQWFALQACDDGRLHPVMINMCVLRKATPGCNPMQQLPALILTLLMLFRWQLRGVEAAQQTSWQLCKPHQSTQQQKSQALTSV
jgi:hypothetical protein